MSVVREFRNDDLEQLQLLINSHVDCLVPGWSLPLEYIANRLVRNPDEYITDPLVVERTTLITLVEDRVCAAAHLLRSAEGGEIEWILAWPESKGAGAAVLDAAHQHMVDWGVEHSGIGLSLPIPVCGGVPDVWPHIASRSSQTPDIRPSRDQRKRCMVAPSR